MPRSCLLLCAAAVVQGLKAKPELNGRPASILSWDAAKGRYNVSVSADGGGQSVLALKAANLVAR